MWSLFYVVRYAVCVVPVSCCEVCCSRFFAIPSLHCELSPTHTLKGPGRNRVQITCSTQSACHVQHAVCHLVGRDSSAIKFDRVGIAFILALFYWLKALTDDPLP